MNGFTGVIEEVVMAWFLGKAAVQAEEPATAADDIFGDSKFVCGRETELNRQCGLWFLRIELHEQITFDWQGYLDRLSEPPQRSQSTPVVKNVLGYTVLRLFFSSFLLFFCLPLLPHVLLF